MKFKIKKEDDLFVLICETTGEELDVFKTETEAKEAKFESEHPTNADFQWTIRELTDKEAEFNTYERDLIIWLFNKQKNE